MTNSTKDAVLAEFGGAQFSKFKPALVDLAVEKLAPIAIEMRRISDDRAYIEQVLASGAQRAREIASDHLRAVKDIVGFLSS